MRNARHWLIVGAGFTGATLAERIANVLRDPVTIIDRRPHLGGNAHDRMDEHGILVHLYGPHIFHTNSQLVWNYLSRFTSWRPYEHRVLAAIDGTDVPLPFNLRSLRMMHSEAVAERLEKALLDRFGPGASIPILRLRQESDYELRGLADFVYEKVFLGYTTKMWGVPPEELDPSVTGRVPVRLSDDDRYFQDRFQAMPAEGYTRLFERMLEHPGIQLRLATPFSEVEDEFDRIVFTGPIDEYFDYRYGPLPYRSLEFEFENHGRESVQPVGTINFPNDHHYTRSTELKHLTGQRVGSTTLVREYPRAHRPSSNEPYYPVPSQRNRQLLARYQADASRLRPRVHFAGRLGDYRYYNMDQAVARALSLFSELRNG